MILVDTSVWVGHLRESDPDLSRALMNNDVLTHPFVIGELACGSIGNRSEVLRLLQGLPRAPEASHAEVLEFIERRQLIRRGLGYLDIHLLASAVLDGTASFWTRDRRLAQAAAELGVAYATGANPTES